MQEGHLIGGGGIFGSGDRRLRPHHHNAPTLKCPRCDSFNTKFCYYNNYNLSQPRHFCRSCNRYWTKGGVLRNVPVGGGCRKTKRSRPKPPPSPKATSRSSGREGSSLTPAAAPARAPDPCCSSSSTLLSAGFPESRFFLPPSSANPSPSPHFGAAFQPTDHRPSSAPAILPEVGSFACRMTDPAILSYDFPPGSSPATEQSVRDNRSWQLLQKLSNADDQEPRLAEIDVGKFDPTVQIELPAAQNGSDSAGILPPFDWPISGEENLFDFSGAMDQGYWTETQWATTDHHHHPLDLP